ncbi:MAG TPA: hypothetical protein PLD59_15550, partial [Tepidisphaeraceae bacterium]|nr:hypothetical protein [Tepidisphaeraceae bacterium]
YLGSIQTIGQDRDAIHFDPPLLGLNAGQIKSEQFAQRLVPLLAEPVEALARNFVPAPPIPEQLNTAPSVAGLIEEGQTVERTLTVDGSGDIRFGLIDLDGSIQMSLVSPNGTVITPTTVNPDISFDLALDGQGFRAAVYDVRSTAAVRGDWIVRLTAPNVNSTSNFAPYVVEAVSATSTISLATSTDRTGYRRGDPIRIEAVLRDASTPVLDGSVAAMVLKPDGQMTSLTLRDDGTQGDPTAGDGRYVGVLTDTQVGGTFRISVKANGSSTRPFSRESFVMAAVARSETRFTGNFIDRGVDLNSNGLFDRLVINAEIAVTHAGTYRYTAELTQNDGTLLQTVNGALGLSAGTQNLPLSFDGAAIYSARLNGPYRLKVLRLAEEEATDLLPLQDLTNAHTTAAYTFHQFEHDDIVALGTGSDQGVDTNANGKFDQLRVTTNVDVRQAGNYQYSARLEDADGTDLGFAAGSAVLPAGVSPIDLTFNGQSIGANGEDGPYFVKDLLIFSSSTNSANIEDVYTTSAYSASQFEGFVAATAVSSFTLVNASNEQDLMTIADGATISLARLPTRNLNVRANVTGSPIGSVVFKLDSQNPRIESAAPFALFGDTNGNYRNGSFALGQHTLIGTPFAGTGGTGTAGTPLTVNFTVIDRAITQFILVNADTEQDIIALTPNMTLNLATFPRNLNVRAVTNGEPVGSVRFNLDGGFARTENADPFALFGDDTSGDYFAGTFRTGNRTMTATPFALDNAKGAKGVPLTLKFKVINVIARGVNQTSAPQNPFSNWSIRGEAPRDLLNRHVADGIYPLTGDDRQQILRS